MKLSKLLAVAVATSMFALSGCGDSQSSDSGDVDATNATGPINIWLSNNEQELNWGKAVAESWNAEHPDEQVTVQEIPAGKSSEEAITAAITAGTTPCLVYNIASAAAPQWAKQGGLVDLNSFSDGKSYIVERGGDVAERYESDGHFYMLPWKSNPVMIMYNKELFAEAGIDPENPGMETFEGFIEGAEKIVASGTEAAIWPSPTSEFYQPWFDFYPTYLAQTGGVSLVDDGQVTFNSTDGKDVMNFWAEIYERGLAPKEASTDDAMSTKKSAMQMAGPWAIGTYKDAVDVGFMPVPTKDGKLPEETYTFADSKNISMFTNCENKGTAWEFLKFTTNEENDGEFLNATGQMPMRTDLVETYPEYFDANPMYVAFADQASRTVDTPNINNSIEVWQTFRDEYTTSVIFDKKSIDDALQAAADKIESLIQ